MATRSNATTPAHEDDANGVATTDSTATPNSVPATLQAALGLGLRVGGTDDASPILPLDADEPGLPTPVPATTADDVSVLQHLQRLAGADSDRQRTALTAALCGECYKADELPEARAMLLGIARVVLAYGVTKDDLVNAIIDATRE